MSCPVTRSISVECVVQKGVCKKNKFVFFDFFQVFLNGKSGRTTHRIIINTLFVICFFLFTACQVDPGQKKQTRSEKPIIKKFITSAYNPSVDILFVIDNSHSMADIQNLLAKNAELFINHFLDVEFIDYHIAVTTSSPRHSNFINDSIRVLHADESDSESESGARPNIMTSSIVYAGQLAGCKTLKRHHAHSNYVDRHTLEAAECLREMMRVGDSGSTVEHFLSVPPIVIETLMPGRLVFYRPGAHLAIVVITDTYDQSGFTPEQSYDFLLHIKEGDAKKIHYAAGIVTVEVSQYQCSAEGEDKPPPLKLMRMVELFGPRGYRFNLCQFDYGKDLSRFASHLMDSVLSFPLDHLPDMDTMEVRYDHKGGSQLIPNGPGGWTYDTENNTVHLSRDIHLKKGTGGQFNIHYEPFYTLEL